MTNNLKYILLILTFALHGMTEAQAKRKTLLPQMPILSDEDLHKALYCGSTYTYYATLEKTSSTHEDKSEFIKSLQTKGKASVEKAGFKCAECDDPAAAGCELSVQVSNEKELGITEKNENGKKVFTMEAQVITYKVSCSLCQADKKKERVDAQGKPVSAAKPQAMADYHSLEQQTKCNESNMIFANLQGMVFTSGTTDEAFDKVKEVIEKNHTHFGFGCKLCPDGTRRCEVEVWSVDGDLREKTLFPDPLVMDSTKEGIIIPSQIIRIFYKCLDCPTEEKKDASNAADNDGDALPDDSAPDAAASSPVTGPQSTERDDLKVTATGTGETTGNIANIEVENTGDTPMTVLPQTAYIPSSGQYQPYIATIPETTLPPGVTTTIPVSGFCVDVHKPPVSNGDPMPPLDTWIPVGDPNAPLPEGTVQIIPVVPVPPFLPGDIPDILNSPQYEFIPQTDTDTPNTITWPGTDILVDGTFVPGDHPELFAPVVVSVFEEVTKAVKVIQASGEYTTPFTADSSKEHQAFTQNVIWWYTAELAGDKYEKDDFATNLYKQFESTTGRPVTSLPEEQQDRLEKGVDDFWIAFTAVGVEAKVISNPESTEPPPPELIKDGGCKLTEEIKDTKPVLDYAIADTGTKGKNEKVKEAFKKAIEEAAGLVSNSSGSDTVDVGFCTPQMPASAWSLYFPHVVAGQANATAFAVDTKNPLESAWTTEPLQTKADGNRVVTLTHVMDADCKSTLVGVNFAKVRASSGLKASLGNIEALQVINFIGEIAIDIVIQRGKGTFTKLSKYLAEKTKDMAKDAAKDFIKSELEKFNNEWKGKTDEEAEQSMDELLEEIKSGDDGGDPAAEGEEFLNDWLAEMLIEGDGFDPEEKIEGDLLDKIDSPIDWSPIKTNTYAIGEGSLDVYVDGDHGVAKAASGVRYKREGLEAKEEAEKGGGVVCDAGMASHTTSGTITLKTFGKTGSWAGATGEGIISTGHGIAISTLESFNGMYVIAICECPDGTSYETFSSITAYSVEDNMTGIWVSMFDRLMNDVANQLDKDIENAGNASKSLPKGTADKIQKGLEDAAKQAAQSILPCGVMK